MNLFVNEVTQKELILNRLIIFPAEGYDTAKRGCPRYDINLHLIWAVWMTPSIPLPHHHL